jgi:hypothetical protein
MAREDEARRHGQEPARAAEAPLTFHQRMLAEIEAALCAKDPAIAAAHVRRANDHARCCAGGRDRPGFRRVA